MLPQDYKFHFINNTGVQLDFNGNSANETIDLDFLKWKRDADGAITYNSGGETNQAYSATDVADAGSAEFPGVDNATDLFDGVHGRLTVKTDNATADGLVELYVEWTSDGGTTFPSDAADFDASRDLGPPLAVLEIVGDGAGYARSKAFSFSLPG